MLRHIIVYAEIPKTLHVWLIPATFGNLFARLKEPVYAGVLCAYMVAEERRLWLLLLCFQTVRFYPHLHETN
jgi:hypothetical protein